MFVFPTVFDWKYAVLTDSHSFSFVYRYAFRAVACLRKMHLDCSVFLIVDSLLETRFAWTTYCRIGTSFHATVLKSRIFDFSRTGLRLRDGERKGNESGVGNWQVGRKSVCSVDKISGKVNVSECRVIINVIESRRSELDRMTDKSDKKYI